MIDIQNVDIVKYGKMVFQDFSLTIRAGEHWVISGPNGSGKTMLLELLAGKAQVSRGKVHYDFIASQDWDSYYEDLRRQIQYIPANAAQSLLKKQQGLFYQQRYYGSFNEDIPLVKNLFEHGLDSVYQMNMSACLSIASLMDLPLTRLSNGQFKKVLITKHLAERQPKLLLLDYPFEGLDNQSRADLGRFLNNIALEHGVQVVLSDHYHDLPAFINRRLHLEKGKIAVQGGIIPRQANSNQNVESIRTDQSSISEGKPVVEMRNLSICYGDKVILEGFNWTIRQGERWALTGANGSGKTTLFSLIYADHPLAYSQEIYLFGKRRGTGESIWDIKRRIHYFGPELISFFSPKGNGETAFEYICCEGKLADQSKLIALITYFQVKQFIYLPVRQLSSGQLQMMLLIICFLDDKELLLLDEPFQFLDPEQKDRVSTYLQHYISKDKTLVLITHYEEDVARWSARRKQL